MTTESLPVRRLRHPGRWLSAAVVLFLTFMFVQAVVTNDNMHWDVVGSYLFHKTILNGLRITLQLTAVAMLIGIVLGVILAVMRLSRNLVLKSVAGVYVWILRGTPLLVQLLFFFFLGALFPRLGLGIPYGPTFISGETNVIMSQITAATLAFGLNEAAYMSEIVRAGIISVDSGQSEAADSLGISRAKALRHIILPQAMRVIIPPTANNLVSLLKATSLVLLIGIPDLLTSAQIIYSTNFLQIPLLTVASAWYLAITTVLTIGQHYLERHFGRGVVRSTKAPRRTLRQTFLGGSAKQTTLTEPAGDAR